MADKSDVLQRLLALPLEGRKAFLASLSPALLQEFVWEWSIWARPNQLPPPGDWTYWFLCCGRGFGKTRTAAEWIRSKWKEARRDRWRFIPHLIGPTYGDVVNTMLFGESGLMHLGPENERPTINKVDQTITWPDGARGQYFSSDTPNRLRGPQCTHAWLDEISSFGGAASSTDKATARDNQRETWSNFNMGFRKGDKPQAVITSTPKPQPFIRDLFKLPGVVVTRGSSYENRANLNDNFFDTILKPYEGTRLGKQEIYGEVLEDEEGTLFRSSWFKDREIKWDETQRSHFAINGEGRVAVTRIVVAIDPAVSAHERSNETGIIVAGRGADGNGYILRDLSGRYTPDEWAHVAVAAFDDFHADRIIAEVNQGGALVEAALRTVRPHISYRAVHASRGKVARAEPVSALYEQGKIFHRAASAEAAVANGERRTLFDALEKQMVAYRAGDASPDRLDALVWALTHLLLTDQPSARGMGHERLGWF